MGRTVSSFAVVGRSASSSNAALSAERRLPESLLCGVGELIVATPTRNDHSRVKRINGSGACGQMGRMGAVRGMRRSVSWGEWTNDTRDVYVGRIDPGLGSRRVSSRRTRAFPAPGSPSIFSHLMTAGVDAGPESASLFPSRLSPNAERDGFGRKPLERSRFSIPLTAHPSRKRRAACCCVTRVAGKRLVEKRVGKVARATKLVALAWFGNAAIWHLEGRNFPDPDSRFQPKWLLCRGSPPVRSVWQFSLSVTSGKRDPLIKSRAVSQWALTLTFS